MGSAQVKAGALVVTADCQEADQNSTVAVSTDHEFIAAAVVYVESSEDLVGDLHPCLGIDDDRGVGVGGYPGLKFRGRRGGIARARMEVDVAD